MVAELLRDPVWQFVGAILTLAALYASYRVARRRKELSWGIVAHERLVTVADEVGSKLRIELDGKPIRNASVALVRISNTGDMPIATTDFETPVEISLTGQGRILSASVAQKDPENLPVNVERIEGDRVQLVRALLNPDDAFIVKLVIDDAGKSGLHASARILGVKELRLRDEEYDRYSKRIQFGASLLLAAFFIMSVNSITPMFVSIFPPPGVLGLAFFGVLLSGVNYYRKQRLGEKARKMVSSP